MIHSVVDFRGAKVRDVMLPSAKVVALRSDASTQQALELGASTGLDHLPVLAPDGQPTGLVNVLDILLDQNGNKPLDQLCAADCNHHGRRVLPTESCSNCALRDLVLRRSLIETRISVALLPIEDLIRRLVSPG